jgi:hypothetical protein
VAYSGRVATIVGQARTMMNDTGAVSGYTLDAQCLAWINQLIRELAHDCLFSTTESLDLTADTATIDLPTELSDYVALEGLWWNDTNEKISTVDSSTRYESLKRYFSSGPETLGYYLDGTTLYLIPTPSEDNTGALLCRYYYLPDELDGTTSYTPPWQAVFDDVAIYYCCYMAYLRERTTPNNLAGQYERMYREAKFRLFAAMRPPGRLRPYR